MSNRAGLSLARGFMQGYGFMDDMEQRKANRERALNQDRRADRADRRAEESHGLSMETAKEQRKYRASQEERAQESHGLNVKRTQQLMSDADRKRMDEEDLRLIKAMQVGVESGNIDPKIAAEFGKRFDVDWRDYADPEFGASLGILDELAQGKRKLRDPEVTNAFNRVFHTELNKGVGDKKGEDTIIGKRANNLFASPDGQGIMVNLDVFTQGSQGDSQYPAPLTEGRSVDDEEVKSIPIDAALDKVMGHKLMYQAIQASPELKSYLSQLAVRSGGAMPAPKEEKLHRLGKGDTLVNSKGETIAQGSEAGGSGSTGGFNLPAGLNPATAYTNIRSAVGPHFGSMNPNGSFMLEQGTDRQYNEALAIAERLTFTRGVLPLQAADIATKYVKGPMTQGDADQQAAREALEQGFSWYEDDDEWIANRAKELLESNASERQKYESLLSSGGFSQQGQGLNTGAPEPEKQQPALVAPAAQGQIQRDVQPEQIPPERVQQLQQLIQQDPGNAEQYKRQFIEAFGALPQGI